MLVKLSVKNFKSFVKRVTIDFNAVGYEDLLRNNKTENNIVKGAIFVGGNATGKTTILEALRFLLELLVWQSDINLFRYFSYYANIKDSMELQYEFIINNSNIKYYIEVRNNKIVKEVLSQDEKEIFSREDEQGQYISIENKKIEIDNIQGNQSALRAVYFENRFNDNNILKEWYEFLRNSVYINQANKVMICSNREKYNESYFEKNGKDEVNKFLKDIGYNQRVDYVSEYKNKTLRFHFQNKKEVVLIRDDMDCGLPITLESEGNRTLIQILPQILQASKTNCMVIIDEFSSAFHNQLEEKIIKYFMEKSIGSQLFIVSHSTNLLSNTLLRPDQIYTVDYIKKKGSTVRRASDSKPRDTQNYEKMYLSGVFDGLPNIK